MQEKIYKHIFEDVEKGELLGNDKTLLDLVNNGRVVKVISPDTKTWKKLIFVPSQFSEVGTCPQIDIDPKHIKLPKSTIFSIISYIF